MTIATQDLADYTPFSVSETNTGPTIINTETFLKFAALTKKKLDRDNPGLETEEYDHCHALLIAHLLAARSGTLEKTTERLDNYSYSKEAGTSSFLVQYETLIEEARVNMLEKPNELVSHADTRLGDMQLDAARLPRLYDSDDVEEDP